MSRDNPPIGTVQYDDRGEGPSGVVPNLAARSVVGVFDRFEDADAAMHELLRAGYGADHISVVRGPAGTPPAVSASDTKASAGTATGAAVGAVIGGAIGLTALALTGVGAVLAAGPILAALAGVVAGGAVGALVGSLVGLGVPTERAQQYEAAVRAGGILVAVRAADEAAADQAATLLREHHARDVGSFRPSL
jgi:hypothetical protein